MRLVSFVRNGTASWGAVTDGGLIDLRDALGGRFASVKELLAADGLAEAAAALDATELDATAADGALALDAVTLLPPVPDPARILCAGVNYDEHRRETGRDENANPTIFTRYPSSLVGHGVPLVKPVESDAFDFEGELAVVIGRPARRVGVADALGHVAGYACFQDGSVRDWQRKSSQFTPGKNFEASGSMGPWLVTADEVADPQVLQLQTILDGQVVQASPTSQMIFSVAELIAFCSTFTCLEPGDVIATGTPGGVGAARKPPLWMAVGSTVEVDISGVGRLVNGVVEG
jgi:2-keto-4-pentenoate hydratase/2-oxohepta-3-ene-1,7-dioic acid hydratase in catechol pathway